MDIIHGKRQRLDQLEVPTCSTCPEISQFGSAKVMRMNSCTTWMAYHWPVCWRMHKSNIILYSSASAGWSVSWLTHLSSHPRASTKITTRKLANFLYMIYLTSQSWWLIHHKKIPFTKVVNRHDHSSNIPPKRLSYGFVWKRGIPQFSSPKGYPPVLSGTAGCKIPELNGAFNRKIMWNHLQ